MIYFTDNFKIPSTQPIEFLDIPVDNEDLLYFIDPFLITNNTQDKLIGDVNSRLKSFFTELNGTYIIPNNRQQGLIFLDELHEPNEYHLGYSGRNRGSAISKVRAETIFDSLRNNSLVTQAGLTIANSAHYVLLLVEGIGQDIMSDTIANVCRDIFADFTTDQCNKHGIAMNTYTRHFYDPVVKNWDRRDFSLPEHMGKPIILTPKRVLSNPRNYTEHYNRFVAKNHIAKDILNGSLKVNNEGRFIRTLKDGTREAIIKRILAEYRLPKAQLVDFVKRYSKSLQEFLDYAKIHYPSADLSGLR